MIQKFSGSMLFTFFFFLTHYIIILITHGTVLAGANIFQNILEFVSQIWSPICAVYRFKMFSIHF